MAMSRSRFLAPGTVLLATPVADPGGGQRGHFLTPPIAVVFLCFTLCPPLDPPLFLLKKRIATVFIRGQQHCIGYSVTYAHGVNALLQQLFKLL